MKNLVICILAFLFFNVIGCSKKSEAKVELVGSTPTSAIYKDGRTVKVTCITCNTENALTDSKCKNCGIALQLPESMKCAYCEGTGDCPVCKLFAKNGDCRFCNGKGNIDSKPCFNCGGSGKCHICKGTKKCDFCQGTGVYKIVK